MTLQTGRGFERDLGSVGQDEVKGRVVDDEDASEKQIYSRLNKAGLQRRQIKKSSSQF